MAVAMLRREAEGGAEEPLAPGARPGKERERVGKPLVDDERHEEPERHDGDEPRQHEHLVATEHDVVADLEPLGVTAAETREALRDQAPDAGQQPDQEGRDRGGGARLGEIAQDGVEIARLLAFRDDPLQRLVRRPAGRGVQRFAHGRVGVARKDEEGELAVDRERPALRHLLHLDLAVSRLPEKLPQVPPRVLGPLGRRRVEDRGPERRDDTVVEAQLGAGLRRGGGGGSRLRRLGARRSERRRAVAASGAGASAAWTLGGRARRREGRQQPDGDDEGRASEASR